MYTKENTVHSCNIKCIYTSFNGMLFFFNYIFPIKGLFLICFCWLSQNVFFPVELGYSPAGRSSKLLHINSLHIHCEEYLDISLLGVNSLFS